jgi:hypothetical protein
MRVKSNYVVLQDLSSRFWVYWQSTPAGRLGDDYSSLRVAVCKFSRFAIAERYPNLGLTARRFATFSVRRHGAEPNCSTRKSTIALIFGERFLPLG